MNFKRKLGLLLAAFGMLGSAGAAPLQSVEIFMPGRDLARLLFHRHDHSVIRNIPVPGNGTVNRADAPEAAYYVECVEMPRREVPEFTRAEFRECLFLPPDQPLCSYNLRLIDADGEVFQFGASVPKGDGQWHEIVFQVDAAHPAASHWGGGEKADGKLTMPVKFLSVTGNFSEAMTGTFMIGPIVCDVLASNAPVAPELLTGSGSPIHVLKKGEEKELALSLRNPRPRRLSGVLKWSLTGVRGEALGEKEEKIALEPGGEKRFPLPEPAVFGVYKLQVEMTDDDPAVRPYRKEMRFAYLIPAGPTPGREPGFVFGIAGHSQRYNVEEQRKMAMAAGWCGAKALREDIIWPQIQPVEGAWEFDSFDRVVKTFGEYGIELLPVYAYCAPWAVAKDWKPLNPAVQGPQRPDYDHWRKFVSTVAVRYRDQVRYAEIWNEPDLYGFANFSSQEYVRMLEIAYEEIKKVAPECQVLTGGFAGLPGPGKHLAMMPAVIRSGKYDIFAFHGHVPFRAYRAMLQQLPSFGNRKPWFANETALSSMAYGEEVQAQTLFRKLIWSWAKGAVGYNWYNLREKGYDPTDNEHHFGMVTMDFYPKPIYAAYNSLSNLYRGGKFLREVQLGQELSACWFRGRDGALLLAAWSDARDQQVWPLSVSGITGKAEIVDLYGNAKPLAVQNGAVTFEVGSEPATLRVTGQPGDPGAVGLSAHPVERLEILPGGEAVFAFELFNPENQAKECNVRIELPAGLSAKVNSEKFQLAPGATRKVSFPVRAEADFRSFPGRQKELTLFLNRQSFRYWIGSIVPIPAKGYRTEPDFVLNSAEQVHAFLPSGGNFANLVWKGAQDLSAKVWLGRDGDTLLLKAEVTDDRHVQPYSGDAANSGDGIQVSLNLPGQSRDWEIRLTRLASGKGEAHVQFAPRTFSREAATAKLSLETSRDDKTGLTGYEARIPFEAIGLTKEMGKTGFRFNIEVNDNDDSQRESCLVLTAIINEYTGREPLVTF